MGCMDIEIIGTWSHDPIDISKFYSYLIDKISVLESKKDIENGLWFGIKVLLSRKEENSQFIPIE